MKLRVKLTERAIICSDEPIKTDEWIFDCHFKDLPTDVQELIAVRLYRGEYICEGRLNDDLVVEANISWQIVPTILRVDGTTLNDLITAVRIDQELVNPRPSWLKGHKTIH